VAPLEVAQDVLVLVRSVEEEHIHVPALEARPGLVGLCTNGLNQLTHAGPGEVLLQLLERLVPLRVDRVHKPASSPRPQTDGQGDGGAALEGTDLDDRRFPLPPAGVPRGLVEPPRLSRPQPALDALECPSKRSS
jgi:hypothetical protein